ncbi:Na(+)-translocating NADH-quinone reductase subunit A [Yoonia algicola]|uniref:Na(+)-translocating NADH-quinone reductase subunit A n=1 Tax=Yoonia algicola TaxID=3137368 RepID=A0AAN0M4S5_9RHOB
MQILGSGTGLDPDFSSPPIAPGVKDVITEEAVVCAPEGPALKVTALVKEGDLVAQGAAVACLQDAPEVCFVAPIAGRVAQISLLAGRKLSQIILFREATDDVEKHDLQRAESDAGLRHLMQGAGIWPWLRRRPFGGMPDAAEKPAAIVVMATDTRPFAPDPQIALEGREDDFARGLAALAQLTDGPVLLCRQADGPLRALPKGNSRIQTVTGGPRHPQGLAGIPIHQLFPAGLNTPVWDIHAEDTAALGALLKTGILPMTRLVSIAGAALREAHNLRTHSGADLRQLTQRLVLPGPHLLMSGSPLDGHQARWLAPRDRQITVLPRPTAQSKQHWFIAALTRSAGMKPAIPTAGLTQAFGAALPAIPFLRALSAGDDETALSLGILSLLEEDVALADYVLSETGQITAQLRGMLDRIQTEFAA